MNTRLQLIAAMMVALVLHIALQAQRLFFPLTIFQREVYWTRISQVDVAVTLLTVIFSLVALPLLGRLLGWKRLLVAGICTLALLRLLWQFTSDAIPNNTLLFALSVIAFNSLVVLWRCLEPRAWLLGLLYGLLLDTALTGAFYSWDYAWQRSPLALAVTITVCAALLFCLWRSRDLPVPEVSAPAIALVGMLAYLALQILYLSNTGYAGLAIGTTLAGANALVLVGLVAAALALVRPLDPRYRWPLLLVGLLATLLLAMVRSMLLSGISYPIAQIALMSVLWQLHSQTPEQPAPLWRQLGWIALGCAAFAVSIGLQYAGVIIIPVLRNVSSQMPTLIAGSVLALTLWLSQPQSYRHWAVPRSWAIAPLALLLVPFGWYATQPQIGSETLSDAATLRVMSYNIRQGMNNEGWANLEALAQDIEREDATVILLQEVSRGVYPNASIDIPEWLSRRLGIPYLFAVRPESQFGNATLTRLPIEEWETDVITRSVRQPRNYLRLQLDIGTEIPVQIINTHLDHLDSDIRQEQINNVLAAWDGRSQTLIGGDLNAHPDATTIQILQAAGLVSGQDATGNSDLDTYVAFNPTRRLDYIFGTPDWMFVSSSVPDTLASDHLPVIIDVRLE